MDGNVNKQYGMKRYLERFVRSRLGACIVFVLLIGLTAGSRVCPSPPCAENESSRVVFPQEKTLAAQYLRSYSLWRCAHDHQHCLEHMGDVFASSVENYRLKFNSFALNKTPRQALGFFGLLSGKARQATQPRPNPILVPANLRGVRTIVLRL